MAGLRRWVLENGWPRQANAQLSFHQHRHGTLAGSRILCRRGTLRLDWSIKFADYDLDGRTDVFITNGIARTFSDSDLLVTNEMRTGSTEW
jgi:hypothetical protein